MALQTRSQRMAQAAYAQVQARMREPDREFISFARSFPSLVHSCGLAQAIAFAKAKKHESYLEDLASVLRTIDHTEAATAESLERATREQAVSAYLRLSRSTLQAAGWIKRYVEAWE